MVWYSYWRIWCNTTITSNYWFHNFIAPANSKNTCLQEMNDQIKFEIHWFRTPLETLSQLNVRGVIFWHKIVGW